MTENHGAVETISATASQALSDLADNAREKMRKLTKHCLDYRGAETKAGIIQILTTAVPFLAVSALNIHSFIVGNWWLYALCTPLAAGFLVRLFIIQHDCGHGSFFKSRTANDTMGRIASIFTFTPYDYWRRTHNMHHAASGNLNKRGAGSIDTLTVKEYQALTPRKKFLYRLYRNPFILLVLGIPFFSLVVQRFPTGIFGKNSAFMGGDYQALPFSESWKSILSLDVALLAVYGTLCYFAGWQAFLFGFMPIVLITAWVGGWLFYIQHQFEDAYWHREDEWSFSVAAVEGSSYYVLPKWLQWFTGNIGLHHIHHLCAMIPNYKLQRCMDACEELKNVNRLTLLQSFKCLRWALWDEELKKMIGFRDLKLRLQEVRA